MTNHDEGPMPMYLNAHLDVDVVALESDDSVTVMLEIQAPAAPETGTARPEHTAVVVLDRSGSMSGPRLAHAKRALVDLVDRLDDRDRFGLVTFDSASEVVVPAGKVGELGRARIRRDIAAVQSRGMTDLSSGYFRGLQEARRVCTEAGATIVLLSDGHANAGVTDPEALAGAAQNAARQSVTTSTVGIGTGYDETILAALAGGGSGNHAFAEHADAAAAAVAGELDGLLSKTVQAASLLIEPSSDVARVALLNEGLPAQRVEGGVLAELGDFYSGETRTVTVTIDVPAMAALGLAQVATLTVRYVELATLAEHTMTVPVSVNVVPADVAAGRVPNPVVEQEKLLQQTQVDKRRAEQALRDGDRDGARESVRRAQERLRSASPDVAGDEIASELAWLEESERALRSRDADYSRKRMSSDRWRKSRGYKSRPQGGEVMRDPAEGSSGSTDVA
jgi:Ca-activated chloride channel family protein